MVNLFKLKFKILFALVGMATIISACGRGDSPLCVYADDFGNLINDTIIVTATGAAATEGPISTPPNIKNGWFDSGVNVQIGNPLQFNISGRVTLCPMSPSTLSQLDSLYDTTGALPYNQYDSNFSCPTVTDPTNPNAILTCGLQNPTVDAWQSINVNVVAGRRYQISANGSFSNGSVTYNNGQNLFIYIGTPPGGPSGTWWNQNTTSASPTAYYYNDLSLAQDPTTQMPVAQDFIAPASGLLYVRYNAGGGWGSPGSYASNTGGYNIVVKEFVPDGATVQTFTPNPTNPGWQDSMIKLPADTSTYSAFSMNVTGQYSLWPNIATAQTSAGALCNSDDYLDPNSCWIANGKGLYAFIDTTGAGVPSTGGINTSPTTGGSNGNWFGASTVPGFPVFDTNEPGPVTGNSTPWFFELYNHSTNVNGFTPSGISSFLAGGHIYFRYRNGIHSQIASGSTLPPASSSPVDTVPANSFTNPGAYANAIGGDTVYVTTYQGCSGVNGQYSLYYIGQSPPADSTFDDLALSTAQSNLAAATAWNKQPTGDLVIGSNFKDVSHWTSTNGFEASCGDAGSTYGVSGEEPVSGCFDELHTNGPSTISQTITTVPGEQVTLSFYLAARASASWPYNNVQVNASDGTNNLMPTSTASPSGSGWTLQTFTFTADSNSTTISLAAVGGGGEGGLVGDIDVQRTAADITNSGNALATATTNYNAVLSVKNTIFSLNPAASNTPPGTVNTNATIAGEVWVKVLDDPHYNWNASIGPNYIGDGDYSNNSGQYIVNVVSTQQVSGGLGSIITSIISPIRSMMLGDPTTVPPTQGLSEIMYNGITNNGDFVQAVRAAMVLVVALTAFKYMSGLSNVTQKELAGIAFKFGLCIVLISPTSWAFFRQYLFVFFVDGTDELIQMMTQQFAAVVDPNILVPGQSLPTGGSATQVTLGVGQTATDAFSFLNQVLAMFFTKQTQLKMASLITSPPVGALYAILIYALIIFLIIAIIKAMLVYISATIMVALLLFMAPIFLTFMLFEKTKKLFNLWLENLISFSVQPILMFTSLTLFSVFIYTAFFYMMSFNVCWNCVLMIDLPIDNLLNDIGLSVPDFDRFCLIYNYAPWGTDDNQVLTTQLAHVPISFFTILIFALFINMFVEFNDWIVEVANTLIAATTGVSAATAAGNAFKQPLDAGKSLFRGAKTIGQDIVDVGKYGYNTIKDTVKRSPGPQEKDKPKP